MRKSPVLRPSPGTSPRLSPRLTLAAQLRLESTVSIRPAVAPLARWFAGVEDKALGEFARELRAARRQRFAKKGGC